MNTGKMQRETRGNGPLAKRTAILQKKVTKQDVNLRKRGFLYFQIGLILALVLVFTALEMVLPIRKPEVEPLPEELNEPNMIAYVLKEPKPELPRVASKVKETPKTERIRLVPVEKVSFPETMKDFVNTQDPDPDATLDPGDIEVFDPEEEFNIMGVEEVPVFPGCEGVAPDERKACFEKQLQRFIQKNQRYPDAAIELRQQGRVTVSFLIDKQGFVSDIALKGPSKILENEAERIMTKLPRLIPGKMGSQPVKVRYMIPIIFQLN